MRDSAAAGQRAAAEVVKDAQAKTSVEASVDVKILALTGQLALEPKTQGKGLCYRNPAAKLPDFLKNAQGRGCFHPKL